MHSKKSDTLRGSFPPPSPTKPDNISQDSLFSPPRSQKKAEANEQVSPVFPSSTVCEEPPRDSILAREREIERLKQEIEEEARRIAREEVSLWGPLIELSPLTAIFDLWVIVWSSSLLITSSHEKKKI